MNIWDKAKAGADAIQYGKKLENSETWKDKAILGGVFAGILSCASVFVPELKQIDPGVLHDLGLYIGWGAYAVFSLYVRVATSDEKGIGKPKK